MKRREFIRGLGGAALWPLRANAQSTIKIPHVGILDSTAPDQYNDKHYWSAFREQMKALGYRDGANVQFDVRWADNDFSRLPILAAELARLRVNVIIALSTPVALAAKAATPDIPIVAPLMADPVAVGLVSTLAKPGGNVTGLSTISAELAAKRLELLREFIPALRRIAILWLDTNPAFELAVRQTQAAAQSIGVTVQVVGLRAAGGLEKALSASAAQGAEGLIVSVPAGALRGGLERITEAATVERLPAVYAEKEYVGAGGLASYGPHYVDLLRRAAVYVDKILKGARPSDLPVEEPNTFELAINLKAANALGLTVSPTMIARADEVIE